MMNMMARPRALPVKAQTCRVSALRSITKAATPVLGKNALVSQPLVCYSIPTTAPESGVKVPFPVVIALYSI